MPIVFLELFKSLFMVPISLIWEAVYRLRRACYNYGIFSSNEFRIPIISIGNISFGGSGKTPLTIWMAKYFCEKKWNPIILTRGYKGKLENKSGILYGGDRFRFNPIKYGDEALLIAKKLKLGAVIVGKNRSQNLSYYFDKVHPDIVLLDDGFQHLKLERDLNIVVFDALLPISRYKVAPRGYLREGVSSLSDADFVIISRADQVTKSKLDNLHFFLKQYLMKEVPFAHIKFSPSGIYNVAYEKVLENNELYGKKVLCFAGLGSPESFYNSVENMGAKIVERISFPDHHFYSVDDIKQLIEKADQHEAILLTSEKDIVKIRRISSDDKFFYLEVKIDFIDGEDELKEVVERSYAQIHGESFAEI